MAGIERANLCGIVAANKAVDTRNLSNWIAAWKGQEILLNKFESLASQEAISFYKSNHSGQIVEKVAEIRNLVLEKANEGNFGITGDEVYEAATQRINILKNIENHQASELGKISALISTESMHSIIFYAIITFVSIVATVVLI